MVRPGPVTWGPGPGLRDWGTGTLSLQSLLHNSGLKLSLSCLTDLLMVSCNEGGHLINICTEDSGPVPVVAKRQLNTSNEPGHARARSQLSQLAPAWPRLKLVIFSDLCSALTLPWLCPPRPGLRRDSGGGGGACRQGRRQPVVQSALSVPLLPTRDSA